MANTIVFFDGACNLCNAFVDFLIRHDRRQALRYASLQSPRGQSLLEGMDAAAGRESVVLLEDERAHVRSSAALRAVVKLGGAWRLAGAFLVVPPFLRNAVYNLIARNRYRWFGRRDTCRVPGDAERDVFLED